MKTIYQIRGALCNFYMRYELVLKTILKFLVYLLIFQQISTWEGLPTGGLLNAFSVRMLMALICVLIPARFAGVFAVLIIVYNVYQASFWGAILIGVLLLVLYIMITRLAPDEGFLLILMPLMINSGFMLVVPLFAGLYMSIFSVIPMAGGILLWGILRILPAFTQFNVASIDELPIAFSEMTGYITNQLLKNENLIFMMIVCVGVTLIVYLLKKISLKHIRYVSLVVGAFVGLLCLLVGRVLSMTDMNFFGVIFMPVLSLAILCIMEFFYMVLNYKMSQRLAFADDDYYYYVQAIPKILGKRKGNAEIKTITNTTHLPSQEELGMEEKRQVAASSPWKSRQVPAWNGMISSASVKKAGTPAGNPEAKPDKKKTEVKVTPASDMKKPANSFREDEEAEELIGFGSFEQEEFSSSKDLAEELFESEAPIDFKMDDEENKEAGISQEKIEELRARTGWSDDTIKGFLVGLDEER